MPGQLVDSRRPGQPAAPSACPRRDPAARLAGPLAKLQAYKRRMGWHIPWVSAANTGFNYHQGASHSEEEVRSWRLDEDSLPPIVMLNAAATGTDIYGYLSVSPAISVFTLQDVLSE